MIFGLSSAGCRVWWPDPDVSLAHLAKDVLAPARNRKIIAMA